MQRRFLWLACATCLIAAAPVAAGKFTPVRFEATPLLAQNARLIDRLLSPFAAADLRRKNDSATLERFPIDPRSEEFGIYVPSHRPERGYGLLVWVTPSPGGPAMPPGWIPALERHGVIFVTAGRSGNRESPLGRRIPLALTAAANVASDYPVDPERVWIGGFSGGARIAERMAVAYPDIFSGAVVDGSSDPFASDAVPVPDRQLFERFLDRSAIVLTSGALDTFNVSSAETTARSLQANCFDRFHLEKRRGEGHVVMSGRSLAAAIAYLDRSRLSPSTSCRADLFGKMESDLAKAATLVRLGSPEASGALRDIDRRFGRLAAPRSLQLRAQIKR